MNEREEQGNRLEQYFHEYDSRLDWIKKTSKRLVEIDREYEDKSPKILQKAIEDEVDFKALYGGNTDKTRKKYVDDQLRDLIMEKERLKLFKDDDNRRISFLKRLIDMEIQLIRYI